MPKPAETARVERRCVWCGAYPIFVAMHGHRCPTTGRFERFEVRLIDGCQHLVTNFSEHVKTGVPHVCRTCGMPLTITGKPALNDGKETP